ncbi:MAG: hypothetical protein EPN21_12240 [Methylococcaceae bacterium]|nr:MAG: hypothetical protein EPN21_12240 [Methylococcaceae bacterium]
MLKKITLCSMVAMLCGGSSLALAHTGVKDQATEGKTLYTAFTIGHGCAAAEGDTTIPVIAQSAVFPNSADAVAHKIVTNTDNTTTETVIDDLSTEIQGAVGGAVVGLSPGGVQDTNVFKAIKEVPDANGNVLALQFTNGKLQTDLVGLTQFKVSGIKFQPTSCAKSLKVRIAVANWCKKTQNSNDDARVDLWFGHPTTLFNDGGVMPSNYATAPYWTTLTVNRDLTANPLPTTCETTYDVASEPSDDDIDTKLPIKGYWPTP